MPTWLVHGFRWPREALNIHIIFQNLDDCASGWLMAPATSVQLLNNFKKLYPSLMANLPSLQFIEQYDPDDLTTKEQPYAYVCDQVHEVKLGVDIDEVRGQGVANEAWSALVDLRDNIAPGEKVGWFVVVNGDVERWAPPLENEDDAEIITEERVEDKTQLSPISQRSSVGKTEEEHTDQTKKEPKGLKKWFRRSKSSKDLRAEISAKSMAPPPLPSNTPSVPRSVPVSTHIPNLPQSTTNGK